MKNIRFLFLDEKSMIGLKLLYIIDNRLRQIFPHNSHRSFGELTMMLFSDFEQLSLVMDRSLYANINDTMPLSLQAASWLYHTIFNKVFELIQQMRQ